MISPVMISCDSRNEIRKQTLDDLASTDWEWEVSVIIDKDYIDPAEYDGMRPIERQVIASYNAIQKALSKPEPWIVFMEDDLMFNKYIAYNIKLWEPIRDNILNFGSLYTPNGNRCSVGEGDCWYKGDCLRLYGSQFYIMSRLAAEWSLEYWHTIVGMQDIKLTRLARGKPIYYHSPSLVDHRCVPSVWGGKYHRAHDFDHDWKHQ